MIPTYYIYSFRVLGVNALTYLSQIIRRLFVFQEKIFLFHFFFYADYFVSWGVGVASPTIGGISDYWRDFPHKSQVFIAKVRFHDQKMLSHFIKCVTISAERKIC